MYPLGGQFVVDSSKCKVNPKSTFSGKKYRVTVITERLVRLEYSATGNFNDRPTQLVYRRNFGLPTFEVNDSNSVLEINTKFFHLVYSKEMPFSGGHVDAMKNLKVTLNSDERDRCKDWYYGHPEARNMYGNIVSSDIKTNAYLTKGLYSLDGFVSIDDSSNLVIMDDGTLCSPPADHLDIYLFMYDKDFKHALLDYFRLTGTPMLIPRYALGNWWSRNIDYNDQSLDILLKNFDRKKIPISVLVLDNDWHYRNVGNYANLKAGYTFNTSLFANPSATINMLHSRGIRVGLCIDPSLGFYPHETGYKNLMEFLKISESTIVKFDPFNPKLVDALFKFFLYPLESLGVDFYWNDFGTSLAKKEMSINEVRYLWACNHYLTFDAAKSENKRGLILARNGITAPHRYGILYGGSSEVSWERLRELPFMMLNASNIGVSWWSHDVGGNHGGIEDGELYIRYIQLATFSSILRVHAARSHYYKREPWLWDSETSSIAADYFRLRHRLIPYLYTEAYNYTKTGVPLIQPFYYNYMWVYDDELYKNQYYFGSQLLVCPILDKKDIIMNRTVHRFFIPDGVWYDFITGKKFLGNKKYVSFFKEEDYPIFAHSGSIIPLSNRSNINNTGLPLDMEIQIFPGVSNTYTLFEDDGISSLYKKGMFLKTSIDYNYLKNNYTVIIRTIEGALGVLPEKRNYKLVFRNTKRATNVSAFFNNDKFEFISYIDGNDFVVEIKDCPTVGQLTINCKGKDIEIDAVRLVKDDIDSILMDLKINTYLKEDIASIMFGDLSLKNKRIAIRKLKKGNGLSKDYVNLFLRLLEYMNEV